MELTKQPADGSNPEPQPGEFSVLPGKSAVARFSASCRSVPRRVFLDRCTPQKKYRPGESGGQGAIAVHWTGQFS